MSTCAVGLLCVFCSGGFGLGFGGLGVRDLEFTPLILQCARGCRVHTSSEALAKAKKEKSTVFTPHPTTQPSACWMCKGVLK